MERFFLQPCHLIIAQQPTSVASVLGNAVSVCIWDQRRGVGGMNHFIEPLMTNKLRATARYGNVATAALLRHMFAIGCRRKDLRAHIVGGAHNTTLGIIPSVGLRNAASARAVLHRKNIKIAAEDIGGPHGRKVVFSSNIGGIEVLKVHNIRDSDWFVNGKPVRARV